MSKIFDTGNAACALAVKAANVDFVAAYPITPQTSVVEKIASYVADGAMQSKYLSVESEHSAASAVAAASSVGARVFTATSSQGLLYMHEILHYSAGGRLSMVMANVNRAVNAPWCLYVDHQDAISQRDTGWIQFFAASNQEIYDMILLAYKVTEQVHLPVMVNYDGFLVSHSAMPFHTLDQNVVDEFLPAYDPSWRLHPQWGGTFGNVTPSNHYATFRNQLTADMKQAGEVFLQASQEYEKRSGRSQSGHFEVYRPEGATHFLLSMGSMGKEMELAVDILREQGIAAAGLRLRLFRPFPEEELNRLLPNEAKLLVFDRNMVYGSQGGVLLQEARSALFDRKDHLQVTGISLGMGGEDLPASLLVDRAKAMLEVLK